MMIFVSVAKRMESIQHKFLWENTKDNRKYHLVAWDEAKKSIHRGGLDLDL